MGASAGNCNQGNGNSEPETENSSENSAQQTENSDQQSENSCIEQPSIDPGMKQQPSICFDPSASESSVLGMIFADGVLIATDTRQHANSLSYLNSNTHLFRLHDNIICGGSGVLKGLARLTSYVESRLAMQQFVSHNRPVQLDTATNMLRELEVDNNLFETCFLVGGFISSGPCLSVVHMCGTTEVLPYATLGDDARALIGLLEDGWREDLSEKQAIELALQSFSYGLQAVIPTKFRIDISIMRTDGSVSYLSKVVYVDAIESEYEDLGMDDDDADVINAEPQKSGNSGNMARKRQSKASQFDDAPPTKMPRLK